MSVAGLQVFDANGKCILDVTTRLTMLYGSESGRLGWSYKEIVIQDKKIKKGSTWVVPVQNAGSGYKSVYWGSFARNITTPIDITVEDGYIKIRKTVSKVESESAYLKIFYGGF